MEELSSKARILDAAAREISERGQAGVRIEHVAARAQVNKSLIYRWYEDRANLFRLALRRQFELRAKALDELPESLAEMLVYWSKRTQQDETFVRLILQEALNQDDDKPVYSAERKAYYAAQIEILERLQERGEIDADADPQMLFIQLLAIIFLPGALPQITDLATGMEPSSQRFQRRWAKSLKFLGKKLQ